MYKQLSEFQADFKTVELTKDEQTKVKGGTEEETTSSIVIEEEFIN